MLVLGGTGKSDRRLDEQLTARGIPTRLGSRSGQPPFDWEDQATWAPALQGVGAAYITYYPDLAVPGAPEAVRAFAETALEQGVRRLVLLSGRGEEEAQRSEQMLQRITPQRYTSRRRIGLRREAVPSCAPRKGGGWLVTPAGSS